MMRSLFAGVSGLKNHQTRMDVIGNNIANVNTVGYKKSRVTFQDMLGQTIRGAASPTATRGGVNPMQVGLGMTIASIDVNHAPGSPQSTGKNTDLAIEGDGFFMVGEGNNIYYTRAGNFEFDENKTLINASNGMVVKGILANASGVIDPTAGITDINLSTQLSSAPQATTAFEFTKNLNSATLALGTVQRAISIYDSKGASHQLTVTFTKTAVENQWTYAITASAPVAITAGTGTGTIAFDTDGNYDPGNSTISTLAATVTGADNLAILPDFDLMTQFAGETTAVPFTQNGYPAGDMQSLSVDTSGTVTGSFSNGESRKLAQITLANFANPAGLIKCGNNLFQVSNNSGLPATGIPGSGGRGLINPERLEMSNVDLSEEFVDMIITQRGFQANSRVITTSDQILEELVNLRR